MSSSSLVNVAEDAELRLVRLLADTAASSPTFVQKCEACIVHGDAGQLMKTILAENGVIDALVSLDDEAESGVSLLAALLDKAKTDSPLLLNELSDAIVSAPAENVTRPISLLATLYNMRSNPLEKVGLLVKMIRLAAARDSALLGSPSSALGRWMDSSKVSSMLDDWKIPPASRRELYSAAAEGARSTVVKQRFMLLLVATYSSSDLDAVGLESTKQAAIGAIRDPVSLFDLQKNILSLPAIQALEQSAASLFALLKVFQEGMLQDFQDFLKSNGGDSVLAQWELSPDTCARHMRILSLCSLAAEHEEIPYALVTETLQTKPEEVEAWVIAAVSSGLVSAKMDQLKETVIVEQSVVRKFDMEQWKVLQTRLHLWKTNVGGILDAYKQSLQQKQ